MTTTQSTTPSLFYRPGKRLLDLGAALAIVIFLWWLFILVALAIKLTSKGPAIFAQKRIGQHRRVFTCFKFRTMETGTANVATHDASRASITGIGAFLRKTKLDELPQALNILRGEMSLVGPRPCLPVQEELIAERDQRGVYNVPAGITGLAQVQGIDMSDPQRLAIEDAKYVENRSLCLDLKLILRTATGGGQGDKVL